MSLAVAVDLVGQVLEAPGLGLGDLALAGLDDFGCLRSQRVNLSLAQILTREKDMLVQSHLASFHFLPIAG